MNKKEEPAEQESDLVKNDDVLLQEGLVFFHEQQFNEAIERLEKAVKINPKNAYGWILLGVALVAQHRFDEALNPLKQVIKINPQNADAWFL